MSAAALQTDHHKSNSSHRELISNQGWSAPGWFGGTVEKSACGCGDSRSKLDGQNAEIVRLDTDGMPLRDWDD